MTEASNPLHPILFGLLKTLAVIGLIYCFIVGIGGIGAAFKLFGKGVSEQILATTASPLVGLFIGVLATSLVQSSSTTTSIVVGLVAAGTVSIQGAIPIVMGANIGTSVTNTMVSLGHLRHRGEFRRAFAAATVHDFFNLIVVAILLPLELMTGYLQSLSMLASGLVVGVSGVKLEFFKKITKPAIKLLGRIAEWLAIHTGIGEGKAAILLLLISVGLTFLMLTLLVKTLRSLVLHRVESVFDRVLFRNAAIAMVVGMFLTISVQSSSITTSLAVPLVAAGVLNLRQVFPMTLGANVGTTVTAGLAALATADPAAITVAFAHLFFNLSGIVIIWPIPAIRNLPVLLAEKLAERAEKNRLVPFAYVLFVFFLLPLSLIALTR